LYGTLSSDERARTDQFYFETDRHRFVVGRGVLRNILSTYLNIPAKNIRFSYGRHGKPAVSAPTNVTDIHFNLAHSGDWIVCAAARARPVGIDIEYVRSNVNHEAMAELVFSDTDRRIFERIPPQTKLKSFFDAWTGKEAYVKAIGKGLSFPLCQVEGTLRRNSARPQSRVTSVQGAGRWSFCALDVGEGYAAALVVGGDVRKLRFLQWNQCN